MPCQRTGMLTEDCYCSDHVIGRDKMEVDKWTKAHSSSEVEKLVLSFLQPTGDFVHPQIMIEKIEEFISKEKNSIKIVSSADGVEEDNCSYCNKKFNGESRSENAVERIQTLDMNGEVTLCRKCYNKAGNNVR